MAGESYSVVGLLPIVRQEQKYISVLQTALEQCIERLGTSDPASHARETQDAVLACKRLVITCKSLSLYSNKIVWLVELAGEIGQRTQEQKEQARLNLVKSMSSDDPRAFQRYRDSLDAHHRSLKESLGKLLEENHGSDLFAAQRALRALAEKRELEAEETRAQSLSVSMDGLLTGLAFASYATAMVQSFRGASSRTVLAFFLSGTGAVVLSCVASYFSANGQHQNMMSSTAMASPVVSEQSESLRSDLAKLKDFHSELSQVYRDFRAVQWPVGGYEDTNVSNAFNFLLEPIS